VLQDGGDLLALVDDAIGADPAAQFRGPTDIDEER
jgi:hypothetical protein